MARTLFAIARDYKKITVEQIAEKLYVSNETVWKWLRGTSAPAPEDMERLADLFGESVEYMTRLFKPEETKIQSDAQKTRQNRKYIKKSFQTCNSLERLIDFINFLGDESLIGHVGGGNIFFQYYMIRANSIRQIIVIADNNQNVIALTSENILEVEPLLEAYDVFTFSIKTKVPVFPVKGFYSFQGLDFEQSFRLSIVMEEVPDGDR